MTGIITKKLFKKEICSASPKSIRNIPIKIIEDIIKVFLGILFLTLTIPLSVSMYLKITET